MLFGMKRAKSFHYYFIYNVLTSVTTSQVTTLLFRLQHSTENTILPKQKQQTKKTKTVQIELPSRDCLR